MSVDLFKDMPELPPPPRPLKGRVPTNKDVLMGYYSPSLRHHRGNVQLRELVVTYYDKYFASLEPQKTKIAEEVIDTIERSGGRFLKVLKYDGWVEAHFEKQDKVASIFRGEKKKREKMEKLRREEAFIKSYGRPPKSPTGWAYAQYREWRLAKQADATCKIQALFRGARTRWMLGEEKDYGAFSGVFEAGLGSAYGGDGDDENREWRQAKQADAACKIQALFRGAHMRWMLKEGIFDARLGRLKEVIFELGSAYGGDGDDDDDDVINTLEEQLAVTLEVCRHLNRMMDLGHHSPQVLAAPRDLQNYYNNNGRNDRLSELIDSFEDLDVILDVCRHQKRMMELGYHSPQVLFPNGEPVFLPTAIAHEDTTSNDMGPMNASLIEVIDVFDDPTSEFEDLMTQLKNLRITSLAIDSTAVSESANETLSQLISAIDSLIADIAPESDDTNETLGQPVPAIASPIDGINEACDQSIPVIASLIVDASQESNDAYGESIPVIASLIDDTTPEFDDTEADVQAIPVIASLVDDTTPDPNNTRDEDSTEA